MAEGGKTGTNEVYVAYRDALSLGKLSGKDLPFGPVRDISLTAGFDFNSKDNAFASKERFLVFGPTFNLKAPSGFFDLGILEYWNKFGGPNHDGPAPATNKRVTAPMLQVQVHFRPNPVDYPPGAHSSGG